MRQSLRCLLFCMLFAGQYAPGFAQTITTLPLPVASVCPGTLIEIPFSVGGTFMGGNAFTVQIAVGPDFVTLPTGNVVGNAASGQYTATATLPATLAAGTYRVRVTGSNPATSGSVSTSTLLVKTQPATAPTLSAQAIGNFTSQYTLCQNDALLSLADLVGPVPDNYRVQYDLGTGLASTDRRTFTAPTIDPSVLSRATYNVRYVVLDAAKGCNPAERPGTVAYLNTEVKPRPGAPFVAVSNLTYCQTLPAPLLQANTTAAGAELLWYSPDGTPPTGAVPKLPTTQTGTVTYQVSQLLDRCEGPRAAITVTVQPASPPPTAPGTRIDLCRGVTSQPLVATGTNLVWTSPSGTTSTAAPAPPTATTTDGDLYFVTQTTTGCPSPRLAIRVRVLAPPTLSLSGGATINLGTEVVLALTFGGVGPYRYRLTGDPGGGALSGSATKDTTLRLLPERSGTYRVAEVSNGCGNGQAGNSATVTVLVPTIRTAPLQTATACAGSPVMVSFQTTGTFNAGSIFRLQLARNETDTSKIQYADLASAQVTAGQISAQIPATATAGTYLIRVMATNPKIPILGSPSATILTIKGLASATLTTTTPTITAGSTASIAVAFTGDGPWTFVLRDSTDRPGTIQTLTARTSPYTLEVKPARTTAYRLISVSNGCTTTTGPGQLLITVAPLLAFEPLANLVTVYPIPATTYLTICINAPLPAPATLELTDTTGRLISSGQTRQTTTTLTIAGQPAGVYWLRVTVNGQVVTKRVLF